MSEELVDGSTPLPDGVKGLLSTSALELYRPSLPAVYQGEPQPDRYEKPSHSRTLAMLFNLLLPLAILVNVCGAVVSYAISSNGAILNDAYTHLGSVSLTLYLWISTGVTLLAIGVTGIAYFLSLDYRRTSRPVIRLHLLFTSFFLFLSGGALGALRVNPDMVWAILGAVVLSMALPFLVHLLEYIAGLALQRSAEQVLAVKSPAGARGLARSSLRFTPANPHAERVYGLALARTGKGPIALPYLLSNSSEIQDRPVPVLAALADIFEARGNEQHALTALEALYKAAPGQKNFERLMKHWLALGRRDEVLRELRALPQAERTQWHDTLRDLTFENADLEKCRAFCREVELSERPPYTKARECYVKLLELYPQDLPAHRALIELSRRRGDSDQSAQLLEQVIEMDPAQALDDRRSLIAYYWTRGDRTNMLRHLNLIHRAGKATLEEKLRIVEEHFTEANYANVEQFVRGDQQLLSNPRALTTLAHSLAQSNRLDESLTTIDVLRELSENSEIPADVVALDQDIRARLLSADLEELRNQVQQSPSDVTLRMRFCEGLLHSGQSSTVVHEIDSWLEQEPDDLPKIKKEMAALLARHGGNRGLTKYLADLHLRSRDIDRAFELYEHSVQGEAEAEVLLHDSCITILELSPDFRPALLNEFKYYKSHSEPKRAFEFLERYFEAGGERTASLLHLEFDTAIAAGDLARAELVGNALLRDDAGGTALLVRLSEISTELGHFDEAAAHLHRARELEPDSEMYPALLRVLDKKRKRARIAELFRLTESASDPALYEELGDLHQELGELREAMSQYQRAIHAAPERNMARAKLGCTFAQKGLHHEADETLQEVDMRPDLPSAELETLKELLYRSAELMEKDGEDERALRIFRRVLRIDASFQDVVTHVERLQRASPRR